MAPKPMAKHAYTARRVFCLSGKLSSLMISAVISAAMMAVSTLEKSPIKNTVTNSSVLGPVLVSTACTAWAVQWPKRLNNTPSTNTAAVMAIGSLSASSTRCPLHAPEMVTASKPHTKRKISSSSSTLWTRNGSVSAASTIKESSIIATAESCCSILY